VIDHPLRFGVVGRTLKLRCHLDRSGRHRSHALRQRRSGCVARPDRGSRTPLPLRL